MIFPTFGALPEYKTQKGKGNCLRLLGSCQGIWMHWGNNHSAVEVIQLEAKSPDRQIFIYIYHKLCL